MDRQIGGDGSSNGALVLNFYGEEGSEPEGSIYLLNEKRKNETEMSLLCRLAVGALFITREQLMALSEPVLLPGDRPAVPQELRRRRRGAALVKTQREYRMKCSIFCFSETWLSHIPDSSVEIPGYSLVRGDRDCSKSRKKKGGGLALYVSERWCSPGHVNVKERLCTPDIELLAVGMRPYYLPREFMSTIVIAVYIPPSADAAVACEVISSTTAKLQTDHPDAFMVITGDFNHGSLDKTLNNFHQYVDCPTRDNKTLDLLYANAMDAYDTTAPPPRQVRPQLSHDDSQEYIRFCEDTTVPARTVHCFPNNKPWITRDLKALLNKKKMAFRAGDREEQRRVQHELRDMLRTCKDNYRRKLEAKLQQNDVRDVWTGMKHITGMNGKDRQTPGSLDRANQFNQFFNSTSPSAPPLPHPSPSSNIRINPCPTVTTGQVKRQLERLHQRKAAGPDGITPRILKTCASQLSPVLGHLYNLSLSQEKVPMLWKTSCLVPGPQEVEAIRPGRLQTSCPHISCDEGPGETSLSPAEATVIQELRRELCFSPFLFTLYTTDFQYNSESCHLQKFSDDSAVVGCIREGEEGEYRTLVDNFVEWSEQNHLRLNVNKTREMVIDFRRKKMPSTATTDQGGGGGRGGGLQIPGSGDRQQTGLEI
ncbi:hypothetical protein L3Q82_002565 [Scortum barcoo]|uniref:Uncharacterized protein n=1 Tax=Scortum barcoo TaxID=214431 RepID=A0ACB8VU52_9TELE|nr:hypothetical protein L3Q82_002565 [Scortum barcoo]